MGRREHRGGGLIALTDNDLYQRGAETGYTIDTTTLAMGMALDTIPTPRPDLDLAPPDWPAYVQNSSQSASAGTV